MFSLILATFLLFIWFWLKSRQKFREFPPGPMGLPILGHIPLLGKEGHKTLFKWSEIYGPVIGISLGSSRAVVIHDINLIREAMNLNELSARPEMFGYIARGLTISHGKELMERRHFAFKTLRAFGVGTRSLESKMSEEITVLLKDLRARVGQPRNLKFAFNVTLVNCLSRIMCSKTFDPTDPKINELIRRSVVVLDGMNWVTGLTLLMPWLNHIIPEKLTSKRILSQFGDQLEEYVEEMLVEQHVNYCPDQPRDIADVYNDKVRTTTDVTSSFYRIDNITVHTLAETFLAGLDSMNKVLQWICLYLVNYPDVQKKVQDEIDRVIGPDRLPSLADRPAMNYTEAVIHEILRHSSMILLSVPRRALVDVKFHGYVIPKETWVIANYYSCYVDKRIWTDPENFRPENFLDNEGKFVGKHNVYIFGVGKRSCVGESLARDALFLFTVNLFQQFTFQPAGDAFPTMEPIYIGMGCVAQPFEVILKERNSEVC